MPRPAASFARPAASPLTLSAALLAAWPAAAAAQFFGPSDQIYGDPYATPGVLGTIVQAPAEPATGERFVQSAAGVAALISPDGSKVWGYGPTVGQLVPLPADVPEAERGKVQPVVGNAVLMLKAGGSVYAFGDGAKRWGSRELGERGKNSPPIVNAALAAIRVEGGVYAYSGKAGAGDFLPLDESESDAPPAVSAKFVTVRSAKGFAIFSVETGKWSRVTYPQPPAEPTPAEAEEGDEESVKPADEDAADEDADAAPEA